MPRFYNNKEMQNQSSNLKLPLTKCQLSDEKWKLSLHSIVHCVHFYSHAKIGDDFITMVFVVAKILQLVLRRNQHV